MYKNDAIKNSLVESLSNGATIQAACEGARISRQTFYKWKREDKDFADAVENAQMVAVSVVEDALYIKAVSGDKDGKGNVTAQIFFLINRAPDRWKNVQRVEHSGGIKHSEEKEAEVLYKEVMDVLNGTDGTVAQVNEILNKQ